MQGFMLILTVLAGFLALAGTGYVVTLYNSLVQVKNNIGKAWHNIDVLLQQRNEELPKLADAVRGYVAHENTLLPKLVELRSRYLQMDNVAQQIRIENEMESQLGKLAALWEGYPDLKANATFLLLQARISALENAIADRRIFFNDTVTIYNTQIAVFPQVLLARLMRLERHPLLDIPLDITRAGK
jgi:LemA protein